MKRVIVFIIFSALLFSKEIILKKSQKEIETNSTIITEQKFLIFKFINSFTPDFLNLSPKDSIFKLKIKYNSHTNEVKSSLNAKIVLPTFEKKISKIKLKKSKLSTKTFKFKITPLFLLYKSTPTPVLKTTLSVKNDYIVKYSEIGEVIYYYFIHNEYKETTTFLVNKIIDINNLKFKISKTYKSTDKSNLFYTTGLYYYFQSFKFARTFGFELNGERKKLPVIYQYKLFFDYRHTLFNKKFIYIEIVPYLFASKDYHYTIKPAFDVSFNINF